MLSSDVTFLEVFKKFAKYDGAEQDLRFYLEVEELKTIPPRTREIHEKIQFILHRYVKSSLLPILTHDLKKRIEGHLHVLNSESSEKDEDDPQSPHEIFKEAQMLVLSQLHSGTHKRFVHSV